MTSLWSFTLKINFNSMETENKLNIFNISYAGTPKEILDYLLGIDICRECNGNGGGHRDYLNSDHNWESGTGDWEDCYECHGTGKEQDEQIINERIWCA